jgi:hypothetical protein
MKISKEKAREIANKIIKISGQDIFIKGRDARKVMARSFFCMILSKEYDLSNVEMVEVFLDNGLKYDRTSIHCCKEKYDNYLKNDFFMKDMKSSYYGEVPVRKAEILEVVKESMDLDINDFIDRIKRALDVNFKKKTKVVQRKLSEIDKLTKGLTYNQEKEILDMVRLKIKSYEWKCSNKTKVYVGSGYVDTTV